MSILINFVSCKQIFGIATFGVSKNKSNFTQWGCMVLSLENVKHFLKMVNAAASIAGWKVIYERDNDSIFAISD